MCYETGIRKGDGNWIIVERYEDKEKAKEGHDKWIEFCKDNPSSAFSIQYLEEILF